MIEEALLPVRAAKSGVSQDLRDRVFEELHPRRYRGGFWSETGKQMYVVGHDHVTAHPDPVVGST